MLPRKVLQLVDSFVKAFDAEYPELDVAWLARNKELLGAGMEIVIDAVKAIAASKSG